MRLSIMLPPSSLSSILPAMSDLAPAPVEPLSASIGLFDTGAPKAHTPPKPDAFEYSEELPERPYRGRGRPEDYNPQIAARILVDLSQSDVGIHKVLADNPDYPGHTAFYRWLGSVPGLQEQYLRAREIQGLRQGDAAVEEALSCEDPSKVQLARLRYDARRWHAGKLAPKVYGEVAQMRLMNAAGDGDATLRLEKAPLVEELLQLVNVTPSTK
jgi:hypothetical protein